MTPGQQLDADLRAGRLREEVRGELRASVAFGGLYGSLWTGGFWAASAHKPWLASALYIAAIWLNAWLTGWRNPAVAARIVARLKGRS